MESHEFGKLFSITGYGCRDFEEIRWSKKRHGIPTITDRGAQMVACEYVQGAVEPIFCDDSDGYRPNKFALDVIEMTGKRC